MFYRAYEVKSSLKVSETYIKDACLQYYVLKNCLSNFDDLFLVTIDGAYEMGESLELKRLFKRRSMKEKAEANLSYFENRVLEAEQLLELNQIPYREIGPHCFKPYTCDFFGHCWQGKIGERSIFSLPFMDKLKLFEWYSSGIKQLDDLKEEHITKPWQFTLRNCILENKAFIDKEAIQKFLNQIKGSVIAMDMEIWNPAIPKLQGCKPFEQIPFLIGLHNETTSLGLFCEHQSDDRENLAIQFIEAVKSYDTLLVYDKTLEVAILKDLAVRFPQLTEQLKTIQNKLLDLFDILNKNWFYHPDLKNNLSLKSLAALLLPDFSYGEVQSGLAALSYYDDYRQEENPIHKELLKDHLIEYCVNDCKAVYEVFNYFKSL